MGITNSIGTGDNAVENTSLGRFVGFGSGFDPVPEPEDNGDDVLAFARFMRATKAPPRDNVLAATFDAQQGSIFFDQIGCKTCHVRSITTLAPGSPING